ncbi:hypothetical protein [Christiangramia echinicola]|uniref:Uncharacterized protein n=1 Tax=Christiangramia echinicola TaxID=279359 RepID=A0A1H1KW31_9FLAO|nr:hypothetical protein [Christiangramia echinicola]SDR66212.1 hypothetical protein SAMN04488552_0256 [Christiangramia echinicola]
MKENRIIKYTGGSRIGSRNLTIPFASLHIEEEKIELKSTGFKTLIFKPENLVDIEEVNFIPFIAQGIRIKHNKSEYSENIIFWSLTTPGKIIDSIKKNNLIQGNPRSENSSFKRNKKTSIPPIAIVSILTLIIFGGTMIYLDSKKFDKYTSLTKDSEIQLEVIKMRVDHGFSFINNKYLVPMGTKLVSNRPNWFEEKIQPIGGRESDQNPYFNDLNKPFTILKVPNSFKLKVIKNSDTLVFELPDPDRKDPNDPTFKDVFEQLTKD